MTDSKRGLLTGALLGDALALGAHWIYDTHEIEKIFGDFDGYTNPSKNPYHKTKKIGDFTHYGDQMMILVSSIRQEGSYNPAKYLTAWRETMKNYTGYMDHASKETLEKGQGSTSSDGSAV
jgi:ADP-ribosylglycohydrolase